MKLLTFFNWSRGEYCGTLLPEGSMMCRANVNGTLVNIYVKPEKNNKVSVMFKRLQPNGPSGFYRNKPNEIVCDRDENEIIFAVNKFFKTEVLTDMLYEGCSL